MTRIVAGSLGGRRLAVPTGGPTRPTSDRVREALFNTLATVTELAGARFADLYAGSGAVGLEAHSRGAAHVLLVENDPRAVRAARANIRQLVPTDTVRLRAASVTATLAESPDEPYRIVFADPPYTVSGEKLRTMQRALLDHGWLDHDGVLVIERATRSGPVTWVDPVTELRTKRYGETTLWYGRRS